VVNGYYWIARLHCNNVQSIASNEFTSKVISACNGIWYKEMIDLSVSISIWAIVALILGGFVAGFLIECRWYTSVFCSIFAVAFIFGVQSYLVVIPLFEYIKWFLLGYLVGVGLSFSMVIVD
jgi:hypothetical protein